MVISKTFRLLLAFFLSSSVAFAEVCVVDRAVTTTFNAAPVYIQDLNGANTIASDSGVAAGNFMVEVDPVNGRRYFTSANGGVVTASDLDGSNQSQLYTTISPYDIGLDVPNGKMYWGEFQNNGNIMCANTSGVGTPVSVQPGVSFNIGLTVDEDNGYVYWYEFFTTPRRIRRGTIAPNCGALTDVQDVIQIDTLPNARHLSLSEDKQTLYFTNVANNAIGRVRVDGSDYNPTFIQLTASPRTVRYHAKSDRLYWMLSNSQVQSAAADGSGAIRNDFVSPSTSSWGIDICESGPQLRGFSTSTADGAYGPGANINITARFDSNLASGSTVTVALNNGVQLVLDQISGSGLSGTYQVGATGSGEDIADLTVAVINSQNTVNEFGFTQFDTTLPPAGDNIGASSNISIDVTRPTLAEVTAVATPTMDTSPDYVFSSNEAGSLSYGGVCQSVNTSAVAGNNTITIDSDGAGGQLPVGVYSGCSLTVSDAVGNASLPLEISSFEITSFGPGGQASNIVLWYRADIGTSTTTDGVGIQTWSRQVGSLDAFQNTVAIRPTFENATADLVNFNPIVRFNGTNQYFNINNSVDINTRTYDQKTFHAAFKTGANIATRQYLFEEGGGTRGLNLYIFNSRLYWSGWNQANDGVGSPWTWQGFNTPIEASREYIATFIYNGNTTTTGTIDCYLNGQLVGQIPNIGRLYAHSGSNELGVKNGTRDDTGNNGGLGDYFSGEMGEFIYYNQTALSNAERNRVESYLAVKYGITLDQSTSQNYVSGAGTVIFNATTAAASGGHDEYDSDIAGIGVDTNSLLGQAASKSVNSDAIITLSAPSDNTADEFLLWGNNNAALNTFTGVNSPNGFLRIPREWRMDETGDVGTVTITIDATSLPPLSSVTSSYVLLVDSDGDFTNGATVLTLSSAGLNTLQLTGFEPGGDRFFTIGEVDGGAPNLLSFSTTTADGVFGPGSTINITANYSELLGSGSTITVELDNGVSVTLDTVNSSSLSGSYTVASTGSGEDTADLTVSSITSEAVTDLFTNSQTSSTLPNAANNIAANSDVEIDVTAPGLSQVTAVSTPTIDRTPDYVFASDEAGSISYSGSCNSVNTSAIAGNTTVTLDADGSGADLADGTYSNCSLVVTDAVGNISNSLPINTFVIAANIPSVNLSSNAASIAEAGGIATITAILSNIYGAPVTINLNFAGNATSVDYAASSSQIVIPAGSIAGSISVAALQDTIDEIDESVVVQLAGLVNAVAGSSTQAQTIIADDDAPPLVTLSGSATIPENGGSTSVTATLSAVSGKNVTISFSYLGDAALGLDFTVSPAQIIIPAGSSSGSMLVSAVDDSDFENDESTVISINSATNANASSSLDVTITITDDDVGCNIDPWLAPTGTSAMMIMEAFSSVFDPNDPSFTAPTGEDFDTIIMGRDASASAARRDIAVQYFNTNYGADFSGGMVSADGQFLLLHVAIDPRYEYKLRASSDFRVNADGGDVFIGAYIMVLNIMNPVITSQGYATLYGTYGGSTGQLVPIGAAAFHGEVLAVTPTDCTDGSTQSESFYLSFESQFPVFLNPDDNVIYYDNVVSGNYGVGESNAKRELKYLDDAKTQARALVTQIVSF